jgi:enediyne biosynthesis protein E4
LPLTFGLGKSARVAVVEITWPNGRSETVRDIGVNQTITLVEGKGLVQSVPTGAR